MEVYISASDSTNGLVGVPLAGCPFIIRNGDEVYSTIGYQNDWNGEYEGEKLPAGTFFIIWK